MRLGNAEGIPASARLSFTLTAEPDGTIPDLAA
jgi:hypothetical protein